jgi:signal transduction histidine kinase
MMAEVAGTKVQDVSTSADERARELVAEHARSICARTDRMFAGLMILQWLGGIAAALWIAPRTWSGPVSQTHVHVWAAVFLGGAISAFPVLLALTRPGWIVTRHVIAIAQALTSALLIHLTGGRIETHFHVFGSLAFLAFYRDVPVLISASAIVALDHALRGLFWPESVYGVLAVEPWRWIEHAGWVVFEDVFLAISIVQSRHEMLEIAERQTRAEVANRELEAFSYSVSHDLRAPLRHINGFAELVRRRLATRPDEQTQRWLEQISSSAQKMGKLIDDLLIFSRMGRAEFQATRIRLDELIADIRRELQPQTEGRHIDWEISPLPEIRGDASMLRLVLSNLISNAVKYTGKEPVPRIEIGWLNEDRELVVFVRDNGAGFDMQYADKLFGVFQRLHRVEEFDGSGIGLANVRRIVHRHGGRTWAEGEVGKGATFYFTLPRSAENIQ